MGGADGKVELGLKDAVRPVDGHEIGPLATAGTHLDRLQALAGARAAPQGVGDRPAAASPHRDPVSNARDVGTQGIRSIFPSRQLEGHEGMPSGAGAVDPRRKAGSPCHQRRPPPGVEGGKRPGLCGSFYRGQPGAVKRVQHIQPVATGENQLEGAVSRQIGEGEPIDGLIRCHVEEVAIPGSAVVGLPPQHRTPVVGRVQLSATVAVDVAGDNRGHLQRSQLIKARGRSIVPEKPVLEHRVRRRCMAHHDIGVKITVKIGKHHLSRAGANACQPAFLRQRAERTVAVVVEELVGAVGVDHEDVEIAVVICIHQRAVDGYKVAAGGAARSRDVLPAVARVAPQLVGSPPAQIGVGASVVVDIAPEDGGDLRHLGEGMFGVELESVAAMKEHGVDRLRGTAEDVR